MCRFPAHINGNWRLALGTTWSTACERGLARPVREKRRDTGLRVLGAEDIDERIAFEIETVGKWPADAVVDDTLGETDCDRRTLGQLTRPVVRDVFLFAG